MRTRRTARGFVRSSRRYYSADSIDRVDLEGRRAGATRGRAARIEDGRDAQRDVDILGSRRERIVRTFTRRASGHRIVPSALSFPQQSRLRSLKPSH